MSLDFSKAGYIYLLTNESFDDMVKIGYTTNPPEHRANELYTTGVPTPYQVWDFWFVENAPQVEEDIHVALYKNRSNKDREFFNINPKQAYNTIISCIDNNRKSMLEQHQARNYTNQDSHVHQNKEYANPKFVELIEFLKDNQGTLFSESDLAKALKMKEEGINKLMYVMEKQETKIIHRNPSPDADKKFGIYFKFGETQLNVLKKKYPLLEFDNLETKLKAKKSPSSFINNKKKETPWVDIVKLLLKKDNTEKKKAYLSVKDISNELSKDIESVKNGIDSLLEMTDDILFVVGKGDNQRFAIDYDFNETKFKTLLVNNKNLQESYKENVKKQKHHYSKIKRGP